MCRAARTQASTQARAQAPHRRSVLSWSTLLSSAESPPPPPLPPPDFPSGDSSRYTAGIVATEGGGGRRGEEENRRIRVRSSFVFNRRKKSHQKNSPRPARSEAQKKNKENVDIKNSIDGQRQVTASGEKRQCRGCTCLLKRTRLTTLLVITSPMAELKSNESPFKLGERSLSIPPPRPPLSLSPQPKSTTTASTPRWPFAEAANEAIQTPRDDQTAARATTT